jgi:class 3 adenylate cyclase
MVATPIVLKLGIHAGPCIAVTTGNTLEYFGATMNIAARLEHQCRGGEVIVSEVVARDAETEAALVVAYRSKRRQRCVASARQSGLFGSKVYAGRGWRSLRCLVQACARGRHSRSS